MNEMKWNEIKWNEMKFDFALAFIQWQVLNELKALVNIVVNRRRKN